MRYKMAEKGKNQAGDFGWRWHLKVLAVIYAMLAAVYLVLRLYMG